MTRTREQCFCLLLCTFLAWLPSKGAVAEEPELSGISEAGSALPAPPDSAAEVDVPEVDDAAVPPAAERTGPLSAGISYYYDSRDFTTLNVTLFSARLPAGFNFWGFVDFHSAHNAGSERFQLSRYFLEFRFRWQAPGVLRGFGLEAEVNDLPGAGNEVFRFGVNYKWNLPLLTGSWLQFRVLPYQTRGRSTQLSLIHYIRMGRHFSLAGFTDVNIPWNGTRVVILTESQLTWHATRVFGVGLEVRYNGFENLNPDMRGMGVALGLVVSL